MVTDDGLHPTERMHELIAHIFAFALHRLFPDAAEFKSVLGPHFDVYLEKNGSKLSHELMLEWFGESVIALFD